MTAQLKSYEELRSQAFKELNIDETKENEHGEIDATEEQWAKVDKRVHELQFEQRNRAKSIQNQEITSEIGKFLSVQTDHLRVIRDNIPSGVNNFQFFNKDSEINWYEFWNHVSDHTPYGMSFKTTSYSIKFNDISLQWICKLQFKDKNIEKTARLVTERLNAYESMARTIRNWEKRSK